MILEIRAKNLYSIGEEIKVDFTVNGNARKCFLYKPVDVDGYTNRVSLINTIIGPNASGKSSILKVFSILKHLIVDSQSDKANIGLYYCASHALCSQIAPSSLGVKFTIDSRIFDYGFVLDRSQIISEKLVEFSKSTERFTSKTLIHREWDASNNSYHINTLDTELKAFDVASRKNASVISVAKQIPKCELANLIADYWDNNVICSTEIGTFLNQPLFDASFRDKELDTIIDNPRIKIKIDEILKKYDIGYEDLIREKFEFNQSSFFSYNIAHKYNDRVFSIPLNHESSGTKRLVRILQNIISAIVIKNGVAIIDELDAFLHPDISEAIVDLFRDESINENHTQIIFTTHNHRILQNLDKQEIFLTEKNTNGETEIWRLDDVENVRADDNYYLKYIAGAYSAKPNF